MVYQPLTSWDLILQDLQPWSDFWPALDPKSGNRWRMWLPHPNCFQHAISCYLAEGGFPPQNKTNEWHKKMRKWDPISSIGTASSWWIFQPVILVFRGVVTCLLSSWKIPSSKLLGKRVEILLTNLGTDHLLEKYFPEIEDFPTYPGPESPTVYVSEFFWFGGFGDTWGML